MTRTGAAPIALIALILLGVAADAPDFLRATSAARPVVPVPTPSQTATPMWAPTWPTPSSTGARSPGTPSASASPASRQPRAGAGSVWRRQAVPSRPPSTLAPLTTGGTVSAIGDSVMVDATPNLRALIPGIGIDAVAGRQVDEGIAAMQALARSGGLRTSVVIALGTNGPFTTAQFNRILALASGRHIVVLTNHCPYCTWVPANNRMLVTGCTLSRSCALADWHSLALGNSEWFGTDGVHMPIGGTGGQAYAELVARGLNRPACLRASPIGAGSGATAWRCPGTGD